MERKRQSKPGAMNNLVRENEEREIEREAKRRIRKRHKNPSESNVDKGRLGNENKDRKKNVQPICRRA